MNSPIIVLCLFLVIKKIECSEKDCITDLVFLNKENFTLLNDSEENFTESETVVQGIVNYDEWNQVIKENETSFADDLPHNVVPEISSYERGFIRVLSQNYLKLQPPFDLSHVPGVSQSCRVHSHKFVDALKNFELWALKMNDATAKISSGIFNGNVNQYGDFDQCLSVDTSNEEFQGKFCLTHLQPSTSKSLKYTNYLRKLLQSHEAFKSNFDDPGHRVPKYSTINWAVCVPSSCSHVDVELAVKYYVNRFTNGTGVEFQIQVEDEMCQVKEKRWLQNLSRGTLITITFCAALLLITIASTIHEYNTDSADVKNKFFNSFSLIKNVKSLLNFERDPGDIRTAHAIRFFNAVMLLLSHKCMAIFFNPYMNRTSMTEFLGKPWTVLARAASLYTDPFLMLSGMLTAYSLIGKLQRTGKINILKEFAGRYMRIMPSLAFLIMFCTFILPLLGDGPQWNLVVTHHSGICKQHWWRNLMFIHNWFGFSNMCLTHTHHVGIDTELFWTAPFLILLLWKWPKKGTQLIIGLAVLSTIARYWVTYTHQLSNYVFFGTSVKQLFETADRMYIMPHHRFTVYAMGIGLGYVLRMFRDMKLTQSQLKIGWYLSVVSLLLAFFGPAPMGDIDYKYDATQASHYAAFAPIAWCIFFGWIILVTQLGYKNKFTDLLEWKGFLICTKISYSLYLTQFPVFFYNVGRVRAPLHYALFEVVVNLNEFLSIAVVSVLLTLLVEMPCNNIKSLLFDRKKTGQTTAEKFEVNLNCKDKEL